MNILMFSQDPAVLTGGSPARRRMEAYAETLGALHVIVRTRGNSRMQIAGPLALYPASPPGLLGLIRAWHITGMLASRVRFDVITAQAPDLWGCVAFLASRRLRVPYELQLHTDYLSPEYGRASWKERLISVIARFLIPRAHCIRAVSRRIERSIVASGIRYRGMITVLPIYTDIRPFFEAAPDAEISERFRGYDFKLVAAGRFVEKEKNFLMLIRMMRSIAAWSPRTLLVIVGAGPDRGRYESAISACGLEKSVVIEPWRDDMPSFMRSFDTFLLSSNYEGWGRVVIEAMAAGLPVIMTDVGLAGEVVKDGENGLVVPVGDRAAIEAAVRRMHDDTVLRRVLGEAGRTTVRRIHPETQEEYLALYKSAFVRCAI